MFVCIQLVYVKELSTCKEMFGRRYQTFRLWWCRRERERERERFQEWKWVILQTCSKERLINLRDVTFLICSLRENMHMCVCVLVAWALERQTESVEWMQGHSHHSQMDPAHLVLSLREHQSASCSYGHRQLYYNEASHFKPTQMSSSHILHVQVCMYGLACMLVCKWMTLFSLGFSQVYDQILHCKYRWGPLLVPEGITLL